MPSNPEIQRNIWLETSPHRLLAMPIVLGLIFFIAGNIGDDPARSIAGVAIVIFHFLVKFWGAFKAASSVIDEVNDRTWDSQKLSALTPWNLTLGKLFGSTIYVWYGGMITFAVLMVSASSFLSMDDLMPIAVLLVMVGLIVQSAALLSSLTSVQSTLGTHKKLRAILHAFFGLCVGGLLSSQIQFEKFLPGKLTAQALTSKADITWYGDLYSSDLFMIVTAFLVLGWLISSIYWQMRAQMKMKTGPWLWVAFLAFWAYFLAGFGFTGEKLKFLSSIPDPSFVAFAITFIGLYFIAFQEPWSGVSYRRLVDAWKNKRYAKFFEICPRWIITFPLCFMAAIYAYIPRSTLPAGLLLGILLCLVARDIALLHFFKLNPAARRPMQTTLFYMAVLYALPPLILIQLHLKDAAALFIPMPGQFITTIISAALQTTVLTLLAFLRWKRFWNRYE